MAIARHPVSVSAAPLSIIIADDVCLRKTTTWPVLASRGSQQSREHVSRDACTYCCWISFVSCCYLRCVCGLGDIVMCTIGSV